MTKLIEGLPIEMETGEPAETQPETQETKVELAEVTPETQSAGIPQQEGQPQVEGETTETPEKSQAETNLEYQARRLQSLADKFENLDPGEVERLIQLNRQLSDGLAPELSEFIKTKQSKLKNTDEFGLEVPVKPADYDPVDAITNPDGVSGQYNLALQDYRIDRKVAQRELKKEEEHAKQEQVNSRNQMLRELRQEHKFSDNDVKDLEQFIANPETYTTENMVKFYRLLKGQKINPAEQKLSKEMNTIKRNQQIPQSVANLQGQTSPVKSDEELLGENILSFGNQNRNIIP